MKPDSKLLTTIFTLFLLLSGTNAFAYTESLCKEKTLDSGETSGIFVKTEEIENCWFAVVKMGDEDWYLAINHMDRNK